MPHKNFSVLPGKLLPEYQREGCRDGLWTYCAVVDRIRMTKVDLDRILHPLATTSRRLSLRIYYPQFSHPIKQAYPKSGGQVTGVTNLFTVWSVRCLVLCIRRALLSISRNIYIKTTVASSLYEILDPDRLDSFTDP